MVALPCLLAGILLTGILLCLSPVPGRPASHDLQEELRRFEASGRSGGLTWSAQFAPAGGGAPVVDVNPATPFPPASLTKLVTAAYALETLGRDYTFETRFCGSGPLEEGILRGDLVVQGGGDPFLVSERLWLLSQALSQTGLREVRGRLVVDTGLFARLQDDRSRKQERVRTQRPYAAGLCALSVNFNAACFLVGPGAGPGDPGTVSQDPLPCDYLGLANGLVTSDARDSWSLRLRPSGSKGPCSAGSQGTGAAGSKGPCSAGSQGTGAAGSKGPCSAGSVEMAEASGAIRAGSPSRRVYRSVAHPEQFAGSLLRAFLADAGILIHGETAFGPLAPEGTLLLAFPSLPLRDLVSSALLHSNNFMTDMIAMPLVTGGDLSRSAEAMTTWLRDRFGAGEGERIHDGSGLDPANRLSGRTVLRLLTWAHRDLDIGPDFVSALPRPGEDGTLSKRFDGGDRPIIRAKTGTYNDLGVSALAGYAENDGGEIWAFVLIMRSENPEKWNVLEMQDLQERWLLAFLR